MARIDNLPPSVVLETERDCATCGCRTVTVRRWKDLGRPALPRAPGGRPLSADDAPTAAA